MKLNETKYKKEIKMSTTAINIKTLDFDDNLAIQGYEESKIKQTLLEPGI